MLFWILSLLALKDVIVLMKEAVKKKNKNKISTYENNSHDYYYATNYLLYLDIH